MERTFRVTEKDIKQKIGTYFEIEMDNGSKIKCDSYKVRDDGYVELEKNRKKAIMSKDGSKISTFSYMNIGDFCDGVAFAKKYEGDIVIINENLE